MVRKRLLYWRVYYQLINYSIDNNSSYLTNIYRILNLKQIVLKIIRNIINM